MPYNYSPEAEINLKNAVKELHERSFSDRYVVDKIKDWEKRSDYKINISESTYNNFRRGEGKIRGARAALVYDFFEQSDEFQTRFIGQFGIVTNSDAGGIAAKSMQFFQSGGYSFPYDGLASFEGDYTLYRKAWLKGGEKYYLQNLVKIRKENGAYLFEEAQRYEFRGKKVLEEDMGFIFPYSTNFVAMTNSSHSMKYFVIHDIFPEPRPNVRVQTFAGNMIAVAGAGPHPSSKFVCIRKEYGLVDLGMLPVSQVVDDSEKLDILKDIM